MTFSRKPKLRAPDQVLYNGDLELQIHRRQEDGKPFRATLIKRKETDEVEWREWLTARGSDGLRQWHHSMVKPMKSVN